MKEFILFAKKARTSSDFDLLDLKSAGRMDLVCRFISSALCVSNGIRKDLIVYIAMCGAKYPPKIISFYGNEILNFEPDEYEIAKKIKSALKLGENLSLNEEKKSEAGVIIVKKSFEAFIKEKSEKKFLFILILKEEI